MKDYKIIDTNKEQTEISYKINADVKAWQDCQDQAVAQISSTIKIPGFRHGKIPMNLIKSKINKNDIINKAYSIFFKTFLPIFVNEHEKDDFIEETATISIITIDERNLIFWLKYDLYPEIAIGEYKKFDIKLQSEEVTDAEVENELVYYTRRDVMLSNKPEDALAEKGDNVNINYSGKLDNEYFEGGTASNYDLVLGSNTFIPGFEDQLIGKKAGEKVEVNVTFPENYHAEKLAGKPVIFEVEINSIQNVIQPELTPEYFAKFKIDGVDSEKTFKKYLHNQLKEMKHMNNMTDFKKQFRDAVANSTRINYYPGILIKHEMERLETETKDTAEKKGLSIHAYKKQLGYLDDESYENGIKRTAMENIRIVLAVHKMIEDLKIEVTAKDLENYYEKLAKLYGQSVDDIKKITKGNALNIEAFILQENLFEKLISYYM